MIEELQRQIRDMEKKEREKPLRQTRDVEAQTDIVSEESKNKEIDKETINNIKTYEEYQSAKTLLWPETFFKVTHQKEQTITSAGKDVDLIVWDEEERNANAQGTDMKERYQELLDC